MITPSSIIHHIPYDPTNTEIVSTRPKKRIEIVEPDPTWPAAFARIEARIKAALPQDGLYVQHVGSTSVPGLPAKAVIDIDVVVPDPTAEEDYVPALESAGFQFLFRERKCPEVVRHRLFRDWLRDPKNEGDKESYAEVKRQAARASREADETVMEYNDRKEPVIREILKRVYEAHGLLGDSKSGP
ncbi:Putative GrpB domain protein (AFU_orthologue; AFUA_1G01530) [Aspergillus calidoustus]|uniref:Putative GrpB domain protein (AFU_orthologue AFUA_1G01530) n=1 Tax=Aspergillus calidoustus TaxID=454130 RepID=A0A0U5GKR7_ASPCI|nr:Putative GrpB domain protein (AFU_orthologue; AFUA_1G01530) [Aspergillus calidoustus]